MTTYPNIGLTLPTRGSPGSGAWGDTLDGDLALIDAHNHTAGRGLQVPTAGLNINADLSFSSLYAPIALHRLQFSSIAGGALTGANNKSLFVSDGTGGLVSGELYYRNASGNNVRFTSGNALNVAAFVGGIGGDYTSVSAALNYDDSGKRYTFKEGTADSNGWARLASGEQRIFPTGGTGTLFVGHAAPAGIASSYTVTWPLALPASAQSLSVDATGQIAFGATKTLVIPIVPPTTTTSGALTSLSGTVSGTGSGSHVLYVQLPLTVGVTITAIRLRLQDNATGPTKVQFQLLTASDGSENFTSINSSGISSGTGAEQTIQSTGLSINVAASTQYTISIATQTGSASCNVYRLEVDHT